MFANSTIVDILLQDILDITNYMHRAEIWMKF